MQAVAKKGMHFMKILRIFDSHNINFKYKFKNVSVQINENLKF